MSASTTGTPWLRNTFVTVLLPVAMPPVIATMNMFAGNLGNWVVVLLLEVLSLVLEEEAEEAYRSTKLVVVQGRTNELGHRNCLCANVNTVRQIICEKLCLLATKSVWTRKRRSQRRRNVSGPIEGCRAKEGSY